MRQRIKKICVLFLFITILCGIILFVKSKTTKVQDGIAREVAFEKGYIDSYDLEQKDFTSEIEQITGQWKVIKYAVTDNGILSPSYSIVEHFLGRSIVIEEDKIIFSIHYWPNEVDYHIETYDNVEKVVEDGLAYGVRNRYKDFWYQKFADQMLEVYTFWNSNDSKENGREFIITEDGKVLCQYLCSWFYMEPYMQADTNMSMKQVYGSWEVERLVSYQDGWKGNNTDLKEAQRFEPELVYSEEEGAYFYPLDYYNAIVELSADSVSLHLEDGEEEQYRISRYESELNNKEIYQQEKGIHDELGLINDKIQVISVDFAEDDNGRLWDGDIVVIREDKVIMKLYQGWFLLTRSEDK